MVDAHTAFDLAIGEVATARKAVARRKSAQVSAADERDYLKAVSYSWFQTHKPAILAGRRAVDLASVDRAYRTVLEASGKRAARSTYLEALKVARSALLTARSDLMTTTSGSVSDDLPPNFAPLASDAQMQTILVRRWEECGRCIGAQAHLAATVMMGGLLEALFVARANTMTDKSSLFKA